MRKSVVVLFLIFVISLISLQAASNRAHSADPSIQIPGIAINAMQKIDPERIRAHVRFLSHDLLEGRGTGQRGADVDAEIVYVGYGIEAPEYDWDDYKGADVKGKVLLMLVNEPPADDPKFFNGRALTYYGRWTYKYEEAARKGAVGAILIHKTEMASYPWEVVRNSWSGEQSHLRADGSAQLKVASWVTVDVAGRMTQAA